MFVATILGVGISASFLGDCTWIGAVVGVVAGVVVVVVEVNGCSARLPLRLNLLFFFDQWLGTI